MRAIGLLRVSTADQGESGLGLAAQRAAVEAAANRLGLELVSVHEEVASGAAPLEKRTGLMAALGELGRGDVLLTAKRDRVARDPIILAMVERLAQRAGARLISAAGEGTGDDDPTSVLMRRIVDAFAEYERLVIGARTKAALRAKRAQGLVTGTAPYGFRADAEGRLQRAPREQKVIAAVLKAKADGLSERRIMALLHAKGFRSRKGGKLYRGQIRSILARAENQESASLTLARMS